MQQKPIKIESNNAVNWWTQGEIGEKQSKKIHKKLINRRRRTLEKRELQHEIEQFLQKGLNK